MPHGCFLCEATLYAARNRGALRSVTNQQHSIPLTDGNFRSLTATDIAYGCFRHHDGPLTEVGTALLTTHETSSHDERSQWPCCVCCAAHKQISATPAAGSGEGGGLAKHKALTPLSRLSNFSSFCLWKSNWAPSRPPAAAAIGPYLAACGRSPEPRTAGLGPSGYGQPGADHDATTSRCTTIHVVDQRGRTRTQCRWSAAIGRLPWPESEESCGRCGGLMG